MSSRARVTKLPLMVQGGQQRGPPPARQSLHDASNGAASGSTATGSAVDCSTPSEPSPARAGDSTGPELATANCPPPFRVPCRRPRVELCVILRIVKVVANEVALERALVVVVAGMRLETTPAVIQAYVMGHYGVEPSSFMVHPHYLEDFLVMFRDVDVMWRVLNAASRRLWYPPGSRNWPRLVADLVLPPVGRLSTARPVLKSVSFPKVGMPHGILEGAVCGTSCIMEDDELIAATKELSRRTRWSRKIVLTR
uniref:Uncharacterized protein n=1 Tax=Setaria viridis TaxID=4556 RepID=A0A4U6TEE3_SETVI|nr:hypothetical protein SEVIR_8G118300v2 [Setaria viridis]